MSKMRRLFIACSCLLLAVIGESLGLNFKKVATIQGGSFSGGYIKGSDFNRDGYQDFLCSGDRNSNLKMPIFSCRPYNRYCLEDTTVTCSLPWDVGFLDNDTLYDLVCQTVDSTDTAYIRVYEQPTPGTLPTILVWSWQYEYWGKTISSMYITDLDRDGLREILNADHSIIYVFETRGDNEYIKVFCDTETLNPDITSYFAVADFDGDGQTEFAYGALDGAPQNRPTVFVRECTGDDQYQLVWMDTLNACNMVDVIACPDLNGNGKPEFMIGSCTPPGWTAGLWLYESAGNNQYDLIYADSITGISGANGIRHSACGDVDMDGRPELVWTINNDWMVYKYDTLAHQFQRVFRANRFRRHWTTQAYIHDMNGNGYPEIIITGDDSARIGWAYGVTEVWEVEACQVVYPNGGETLYCDTSYTIRWRNVAPFVADSFSLFYSTDSSRTYSLIAHGIPGSDSTYVWTVPDTLSDTCFLMLWAYQNATGWDFSDSHFRIRNGTGVEAPSHVSPLTSHLPYRVAPNPFLSYASVPGHERESFALYDVSGRKVGTYKGDRIGSGLSAGIYFLKPEGQDAKPLRIVKLR